MHIEIRGMIMELLNKIRLVIGFILFGVLAINFFYQVVKAFRKMNRINYSEEKTHTFKCRKCGEAYQMNGKELQAETGIWSTKMEIKTPKGQTQAIRFECRRCHKKGFQEKVYAIDETAMLGNVRAQFDHDSREVLMDILVKGFSPILVGALLISFLL